MVSNVRVRPLVIVILLALSLSAMTLSGCSLGEPDYTTYTEQAGSFHIKIPANWSGEVNDALMAIAATEDLPSQVDTIDRFWLLIYPSAEASEAPIADVLPELVTARSEVREWQDAEFGEIEETEIGSRKAVMMTASGKNASGESFDALYYLVRTQGNDIIISAIAPAGTLDEYTEDLDGILSERWFWHGTADVSDETSETEVLDEDTEAETP